MKEGSLAAKDATSTSNLPAGVTSFLGREDQLVELAEAFERSRLVTLTGAPGIGKSRLGLEVARRLAEHYQGGVWLAELASAHDGDQVCSVLATALALPDAPGRTPADRLVRRL